jgi:hypothetical protein
MNADSWSRSRSSASGGWARRPPRGFAPAGSPPSATSAAAARPSSLWPWARPPPGTCTRSPATATHDRCAVAAAAARSAPSRRSARAAVPAELDAVLVALVDRVTRRMRASRRAGRTVTLRLRFGDFSRASRSRTLPHLTDGTGTVLAAARMLLAAAMPLIERRGVTLLGSRSATSPVAAAAPSSSCPSSGRPTRPWTPPSTRSATASARTRSVERRPCAVTPRSPRGCAQGRKLGRDRSRKAIWG